MRSLSGQAQRFSLSLDHRIPAAVSPVKSQCFYSLQHSGTVRDTKKSAVHTGPVMTLLDLVVHVPVNCGSVCADTEDISSALTASDDRRDKIMKYDRC